MPLLVITVVDDLLGNVTLCHNSAFDGQHVQELGDGDDLIGLVGNLDLSQRQALTSSEGRNHMDRCLGASLLKGTSQRLAINGHDLGWNSRQRGHPGYKTALKLFGIQRGKDVAQMVMGGRSMLKSQKPAQKIELFLAKPGNIDDGLCASQDCQQAQQQNLVERVHHLAALSRIGQIPEVIQKNQAIRERSTLRRRYLHSCPPIRIRGLPQIQHFRTLSRTSSPDCPDH